MKKHLFIYIPILLVNVGLFFYGFFVEPQWLKVNYYDIKQLPSSKEVTVVQISDLHLNSIGLIENKILNALHIISPDIVIFNGDTVDSKKSVRYLDEFLRNLPQASKIAVLGNWEHWSGVDLETIKSIYSQNGVNLLVNECKIISHLGKTIGFIGLDDYSAGNININSAFKTCDKAHGIVLIEHSPQFFEETPNGFEKNIVLNLSGHTHGGQITLAGFPIITPPGSGRFTKGWYETAWGRLFVSSGVGTSVIPLRIGSRPEISVFKIN